MGKFGKTLFGGSRFVFRSVAPALILCAAVMPFVVREWTTAAVVFVSFAEALLVSLVLALYDPSRFWWATRCVTGIVFCAYLIFAVDELFLSPDAEGGSVRSFLKPLMGFVAIALPCLWYTIFGRFSLRGDESRAEQEMSDKVDATDLDL